MRRRPAARTSSPPSSPRRARQPTSASTDATSRPGTSGPEAPRSGSTTSTPRPSSGNGCRGCGSSRARCRPSTRCSTTMAARRCPRRRRRRPFERVLTQLPQGVVLVDSKLVIEYANPAARKLLGVGAPGVPLPEPWPDFSLRDLAASLFGSRRPAGGTLVNTEQRFLWIEGLPPSTAENAILIVEDVTERERARRNEREFVENAAHELRTPLAAIVSVMDVLESGAKDIPEARDRFLKHIRVHSERLSRLARSLLVLARLQTGVEQPRLTAVPMRPLLEEIAGRLDPAHGA